MGGIFDTSFLANKAVLQAVGLAVLALAATTVTYRINHVTAASGHTSSVITIPANPAANAQASSAESSATSADPAAAGSNTSNSQTSLTVNGQTIDVPPNGSVAQTLTYGNTTTTVDAQNSSSSSSSPGRATNTNHSSVNVRVNSNNSSQDSL